MPLHPQRRDPLEADRLLCRLPLPVTSEMVMDSRRRVGHHILARDEPALVLDAWLEGCPVVGVSAGCARLTGRPAEATLGQSWRDALLGGLEELMVARSTCQDIDNFLQMARLRRLDTMADCSAVLMSSRADGSTFKASLTLRLLKVPGWSQAAAHGAAPPAAACLLQPPGPGPAPPKWPPADAPGAQRHLVLVAVRDLDALDGAEHRGAYQEESRKLDALSALLSPEVQEPLPDTSFFPFPLSFKCILMNRVSTGMRREPHQVPRGCILMSAASVPLKAGVASFEVVVERTLPHWASRLPFLGFTCTTPEEVQGDRCFFGPSPHAFCLGESVTIGGTGEAWLRLGGAPLKPAIGQRLDQGAERKHLTPDLPEHKRCAPVTLRVGDVLGCRYAVTPPADGQETQRGSCSVSLYVNGSRELEFELEGHLPANKPLYVVVDVCYSVYQISMVSEASASAGSSALMGG